MAGSCAVIVSYSVEDIQSAGQRSLVVTVEGRRYLDPLANKKPGSEAAQPQAGSMFPTWYVARGGSPLEYLAIPSSKTQKRHGS
jgi:hypothetical protein